MISPAQYASNPEALKVGDVIVGKNASKAAAITTKDGRALTLKFGSALSPLHAPFGLSSWGDTPTDRVSLDLRATPEIEACVTAIDANIVNYIEANCKRYFGNNMKAEKVREYFRPTLKIDESGKYDPLVKCKLSKSKVKVWGPNKEVASADDIRPHSEVSVVLTVRSVYFQSMGWGITLECQHVGLANSIAECPFSDGD